jgi:hypothetical protein
LVLPARPGGRSAGPFDLFQEPPWRFRESDLLRHVFEAVVRRCIAEGLVGGDGFEVDASLIRADASPTRAGIEAALADLAGSA